MASDSPDMLFLKVGVHLQVGVCTFVTELNWQKSHQRAPSNELWLKARISLVTLWYLCAARHVWHQHRTINNETPISVHCMACATLHDKCWEVTSSAPFQPMSANGTTHYTVYPTELAFAHILQNYLIDTGSIVWWAFSQWNDSGPLFATH